MSCFLVVSEQPPSRELLRGRAAFVHAGSLGTAKDVLRSITPSAALVSPDMTGMGALLEELARRGVPTIVAGGSNA